MLNNKTVLVTGGTGSFGRAFVKEILKGEVKKVIIFSRDELKQWEMQQEIKDERVRYFLGDVRDKERLQRAFTDVGVVVHAAALKQVPAAEYNPSEFIKTNILGTENVLYAAVDRGVDRVLVLSSDKAAAPVTAYGATKAMVEHLVRAGQNYSTKGTMFASLRYGNVAGSRGSVIPAWRSLVAAGEKTLPITDVRMTRFFFKLSDAVAFALRCLRDMRGGELFVPKMASFRVTDLAAAMGCDYHITGTRTVEKIAEVMVTEEEARYFHSRDERFVRYRDGVGIGNKLPSGFEYRSDTNSDYLSVEDLKRLVEQV